MNKRYAVRALAPALLVTVALTGCGSSDGGTKAADRPAQETKATPAGKPVTSGGTIGPAGSACPMPVTFDYATSWTPKGVKVDPDAVLAELAQQGKVTVVCEINAKATGNIGFLRVWAGEPSDISEPREALEAFLADEESASKVTYTAIEAGSLAAAEVTYTTHSELLDESKPERAFAVSTPDGPVVVHLGGLDSDEHRQMLPAYELAKRTLKAG